jgi:hypothetical protein
MTIYCITDVPNGCLRVSASIRIQEGLPKSIRSAFHPFFASEYLTVKIANFSFAISCPYRSVRDKISWQEVVQVEGSDRKSVRGKKL